MGFCAPCGSLKQFIVYYMLVFIIHAVYMLLYLRVHRRSVVYAENFHGGEFHSVAYGGHL